MDASLLVSGGYLVAGAILGGFVNGLTGFGFALMASGLWLQVLLPTQMVPLLVISMLAANLQALPRVWRMIEPRRTLPLVIGGLVGVPFGVWLLPRVPLDLFKLAVVGLILLNLVFVTSLRGRLKLSPRFERLAPLTGFVGGLFGGLNGLSGIALTIWAGLFGWSKREKRGVFQGYNLTMALVTLTFFYAIGLLTPQFWRSAILVVPVALVCSYAGVRVFERLADKNFTLVINGLLLLSALNLLASIYF